MAMMDLVPLSPQTKPMVIAIMNGEHSDAMRLYVMHFGQREAASAKLVDLDAHQIHLEFTDANGEAGQKLSMPYRNEEGDSISVDSVGDCRRALVGMARVASAALGEPIDLPEPHPQRQEEPSDEEVERMMRQFQDMLAKGAGKGTGSNSASTGASSGIRTLHDGGASGGGPEDMLSALQAIMAAKGKGKGKAAGHQDVRFQGEGSRLGSTGDGEATQLTDSAKLAQQLREVDESKAVLKLRVRLLNRKTVEVDLNPDFTVREVRTWLEAKHAESFDRGYHLMDGSGFPPKKLAEFDATLESLGVKAGSCLECRPA